jgi:hypothetical protein
MEGTPRLYDTLVEVLSPHQNWVDLRHLKTLAWMIVGLIQSGKIGLTAWALYVHSRAVYAQSRVRPFARWLENDRIDVHALYGPLIQQALTEWGSHLLYLPLDTSALGSFWIYRCGKRHCKVNRIPLAAGQALFWHHVHITKNCYGPVHLALGRPQDSKEYWFVVAMSLLSQRRLRSMGGILTLKRTSWMIDPMVSSWSLR